MLHVTLLPVDPVPGYATSTILEDLAFDQLERFFPEEPKLFASLRDVLLVPLTDGEKIRARQAVLKDFLAYPSLATQMMAICAEAASCKAKFSTFVQRVTPKDRLKSVCAATYKLLTVVSDMGRLLEGRRLSSPIMQKVQVYFFERFCKVFFLPRLGYASYRR